MQMHSQSHSLTNLFEDIETAFDCPSLTEEIIYSAERTLGYKLPAAYIEMLRVRNGGLLRVDNQDRAACHFALPCVIYGIGGDNGIDSDRDGVTLSEWTRRQWHYPEHGVVFSHFGHAGFMLDYAQVGSTGDPTVIYLDCERYPLVHITPISASFERMLAMYSGYPRSL